MPVPVRVFSGLRKRSKIYHDGRGYYYHHNRKLAGGRNSLRCIRYRASQCPGRASTDADFGFLTLTKRHNHGRRPNFIKKRKLRFAIMKRCASRDPTSFVDIVEQESQGYSLPERAANDANTLRSSMRRARNKKYPKLPNTLSDLGALLNQPRFKGLVDTKDGKDNLFRGVVGSSESGTRSVIFMTRRQRRLLKRTKTIFADGTWKSRPAKPNSGQLFSISRTWRHHVIPLAQVLMQKRTKRAYRTLLRALRRLGLDPKIIHTDFEEAEFDSFKAIFPHAKVDGCLYHYVQNLKEYARGLGLTHLLKTNRHAARAVRLCNAIALLPHHSFRCALLVVVRYAKATGVFTQLKEFLRYVKSTWLKMGEVLSVYRSKDRTNNVAESWNRSMKLAVKVHRPSLWVFLDSLLKLEDRAMQDIYTLKRGGRARRLRKASAVNNDHKIKALMDDLENERISLLTFLRHASHRMDGVWNPGV